ncbi:MAG TPA: hypothetical protein VGF76_26850 [Polyangiaceae bacterium]
MIEWELTLAEQWERTMSRRRILPLRPGSPIAIKRDVHSFAVNASASELAQAFAHAMADPARSFGLVRVRRTRERSGQPFVVGDRFQGRFSMLQAVLEALPPRRRLRGLEQLAQRAAWTAPLRMATHLVEDRLTSDYGEVVEINLNAPPYGLRYVYLDGSYIAGGSSISIEQVSSSSCRAVQVFEYQELRLPYVMWLGTSVLPMHYAVVYSQISQAAELAGARVTDCDVPREYLRAVTSS